MPSSSEQWRKTWFLRSLVLLGSVGAVVGISVMSVVGNASGSSPAATVGPSADSTFTNPIITSEPAPDPSVIYHDGWYYLTATFDASGGIHIWKSRHLTDWTNAQTEKVWTAPDDGPMSQQIWAPELQRLNGRWYVYFTASDGLDENHRHYVLESQTEEALGDYDNRGRIDAAFDEYAIDGAVLETEEGDLYWLYTAQKRLAMAPMTNPWTVDSTRRVRLAEPSEPWERGWIEAPEALVRDEQIFVIYSAGHSGTPHYVLGRLRYTGGDLLDPAAWEKHPTPIFTPYVGSEGAIYTTGHCTFTQSPDGTEDWIVYHGKSWRDPDDQGFAGRMARAQPFEWTSDGLPDFGTPVPDGVSLKVPSGAQDR